MKPASQWFAPEDRVQVANAVGDAERSTAGEIVPVVATRSGTWAAARLRLGALAALANGLFALLIVGLAGVTDVSTVAAGAAFVGFALGWTAAHTFPGLCMRFVPEAEVQEAVSAAARAAFERYRVHRTEGSTGLVIFVSIFEGAVEVQGDEAIRARLCRADWGEVRNMVLSGLSSGHLPESVAAGVRRAGELLAAHFPATGDDVDELSNELRLID